MPEKRLRIAHPTVLCRPVGAVLCPLARSLGINLSWDLHLSQPGITGDTCKCIDAFASEGEKFFRLSSRQRTFAIGTPG